MITASFALPFSLYLLHYHCYILSLQSYCQSGRRSLKRCTSQPKIGLLVFACLHREVVTNLISSFICCHEFTAHHFLIMACQYVKKKTGSVGITNIR